MATSGTNTARYSFFLPDDNSDGWGASMRAFISTVDADLYSALAKATSAEQALTSLTLNQASLSAAQAAFTEQLVLLTSSKANVSHQHAIGDVTGLQTALTAKANVDHTHAVSNIDGLTEALAAKANVAHTHPLSQIQDWPAMLARIEALETGRSALSAQVVALGLQVAGLQSRVSALETSGGGGGGPSDAGTVAVDFSLTSATAAPWSASFNGHATTTQGVIVAYEWAFGDGATATAEDPTHVYAAPGDYSVTLLARNSLGASSSVTQVISIVQMQFDVASALGYGHPQGPLPVTAAARESVFNDESNSVIPGYSRPATLYWTPPNTNGRAITGGTITFNRIGGDFGFTVTAINRASGGPVDGVLTHTNGVYALSGYTGGPIQLKVDVYADDSTGGQSMTILNATLLVRF